MPALDRVRIGTYNCENLFERPKILEAPNAAQLLQKLSMLQIELAKAKFDKKAIESLLEGLKGYVELNEVRNRYHYQGMGRDKWLGWPEFVQTRVNDTAIANTARVLNDIDCDILCTPEVEDRWTLHNFLRRVVARDFPSLAHYLEVLLLDGNDERGIDVGMLSRFPLRWMKTHISETTNYFGNTVPLFSRDCPEYCFVLGNGLEVKVLGNHLKARTDPRPNELPPGKIDKQSRERRRQQAARIASITQSYNLTKDLVVVAGDLNDAPDSWSLEPLFAVKDLHNLNDSIGTHRDEPKPIDFLLVSTALKERIKGEVKIERRGIFLDKADPTSRYDTVVDELTAASDHAAVWADFDLT